MSIYHILIRKLNLLQIYSSTRLKSKIIINEVIISNNILDKIVATEDINWEIKKISSHRMKNDIKQLKVHYLQQKKHRYMRPQYF
jgi:hypothetical protein